MEISPVAGALGAEIYGIDISKKLSNAETKILQENFLKYKVLFFSRPVPVSQKICLVCKPLW